MTAETLWNIFDLFVNIVQGAICTIFVVRFLGYKDSVKHRAPAFILSIFLVASAITAANYFSYYEGIAIFSYSLALFLFALAFLRGQVSKKIFAAIVPINAMAVGSIFATNFISFAVDSPIYEFMTQSPLLRLAAVAIANVILFAVPFVILMITKKGSLHLKDGEWLLLGADLALSIVAYMFLYYAIYSSESIKANFFTALSAVVIIVINVTLYILLVGFGNRHDIELENSLLRQQVENQTDAIRETKKQYENIQKIRHDFKNTLGVIRNLNSDGKSAEVENYIGSYLSTELASSPVVDTGNDYINAVINSKTAQAAERDIHIVLTAFRIFDDRYNIDLCNLLGNLFDNAIEACAESSKKSIRLDLQKDGESTVITMKNSIDASVLETNPELVSTKKDGKNHGYGTKIIKEIAEKHRGFADFYEQNGYFCCNVVMYL